jgi:hypothetical protein
LPVPSRTNLEQRQRREVVRMSRTADPDADPLAELCEFCGLPIEEDDDPHCPALDDGRCLP